MHTISFQALDHLRSVAVDPNFEIAARNAVCNALGLEAGDRLAIVAETGLDAIAASLVAAAEAAGVEVTAVLVDADRVRSEPFVERLEAILADVDGSIFVGSVAGLPKAFRRRLLRTAGTRRRHAHMAGIGAEMMRQSMRADWSEVDRISHEVAARLGSARRLLVTTSTGSSLEVELDPARPWCVGSGWLRAPGWTNLPGGEVYASPRSVEGVLVPDGGIWLPDGSDLGRDGRLRLVLTDGRLDLVEGDQRAAARLLEVLDAQPHGRRVGIVGLGTNVSILAPTGMLLQDLKMPGVHLTFGATVAQQTGADWDSLLEVPALVRRPDVWADGDPIMVRGRYARSLLERGLP